jgi:hypothetical protein
MPSDASVVGSLVSLNDNTRVAAVDQQPLVTYGENGLLRVIDETRKAGSAEDVTKVLDIVLYESRSKFYTVKLCTILPLVVVLGLYPMLNPADRLTVHSKEEETKHAVAEEATKQATEATKQATEVTKQATEVTKQAEFDARARQAAAEEATKQAEIITRAKREEDERRADETAQQRTIILL